jgi:hypothetical protein
MFLKLFFVFYSSAKSENKSVEQVLPRGGDVGGCESGGPDNVN